MRVLAIAGLAGSLVVLGAQTTDTTQAVQNTETTQAQAVDRVTVFNAQLSGPSGTTNGKIVVTGDRIIFVDDERPEQSFAVGKGDVRKLTFQQGELSVDLGRPVTDRFGSRTNLVLRTDNPQHIQSVATWAGIPMTGGTATVRTDEARDMSAQQQAGSAAVTPGVLSFDARHDHAAGNCYGKLLVSSEGLRFESVGERDHSRSWKWNELEEVDRNPSEQKIIIEPNSGEDFTLKLSDGSQFDNVFRAITDRMVSARPRP